MRQARAHIPRRAHRDACRPARSYNLRPPQNLCITVLTRSQVAADTHLCLALYVSRAQATRLTAPLGRPLPCCRDVQSQGAQHCNDILHVEPTAVSVAHA